MLALSAAALPAVRSARRSIHGHLGLTGEWAGDYSSVESGRSGSISFTLRAAGDSAFGDVVMIPSLGVVRSFLAPGERDGAGANQHRPRRC